MAASGTFNFAPGVGECVLNALSRIQIRGPAIVAEHMEQASMEANLMQAEWSNRGPNLWTVDDKIVPCVSGQAIYSVPQETVMVLDVTIGTDPLGSDGLPFNEIRITSLSRSDYMSYPNKSNPGRPTSYWFDRLIAPTITLWPVPDASIAYYLHYYRFRQIQDAVMSGAGNFETPYLWLDAACAGLSHRLSRHFAPALEQMRKQDAAEAYKIAADQNVEDAPLRISPMLSGYYR